MCDCLEKKDCCGCLKGGCECICECSCHTGDSNDPCWAFPTMFCGDCVARRKTVLEAWEKAKAWEEAERSRWSKARFARLRYFVDRVL